jgi:hypothetical protein
VTLTYTTAPEPVTVITYAGQYKNLRTMTTKEIKWLQSKLDKNNLANLKHLSAIQAELERRKPSPEKLKIIEIINNNAYTLSVRFLEVLDADRLLASDLVTVNLKGQPTANRLEEGFDLAVAGRWEMPAGPGWPFQVDSFEREFGSLKYQVKTKSKYHNYNYCTCEDYTYKAAGKFGGNCKHVICCYLVSEAQVILAKENN